MNNGYKPDQINAQRGTDRQGQPWVGFDFAALDLPEFLHDPTFRHFVEALDYMARGIALDMFVTVLANHSPDQIKAFVLHGQGKNDREIGKSLNNVDHKTAKRWYEDVQATIRLISPLGQDSKQDRPETADKRCPNNSNDRDANGLKQQGE